MFHKEGYQIIMTSFVVTAGIVVLSEYSIEDHTFIKSGLQIIALLMLILILQFFRNPKRETPVNDKQLIAPVDGKVVIIKEVFEKEYFKDNRLQVSIFMSPLNVHVTRYTMSGKFNLANTTQGNILWHGIQNLQS